MGNHTNTNQTNLKYLKGTRVLSPSSSTLKGVQLITFVMVGLLTSFGVSILSNLAFGGFFSNSAYAAFSASISRSGTINLAESGSDSIRPTSSGTLGTGSDTVSITTNCTYSGYKVYVSATSTGGTNLNLSGASASELTNAKNYIATSSTATGSETTLGKDTWGVGKTASAFAGLQSYTSNVGALTPSYTDTTSNSFNFYYGVNVSTAKTPGTYGGEVLYTVLMNDACLKYTLNFNGNSATTNTLTSQDLTFDSTIDLSTISSSSVIARTGYTLTGWKDQNNNEYGTSGTADINPSDLASVTLTAQWTANSYAVVYNANGGTGTTASQTGQTYGSNVTLRANGFTYASHTFLGWSLDSTAEDKSYDASTTYTVAELAAAAGVTNTNGATITLYAIWEEESGYALTLKKGNTTAIASVALTNTSTGATITSGSAVAEGTSVTATCTPKSGYHCTEFTSSDTTLLPSQTGNTAVGTYTYSFTMPAGAITLTAKGSGNTFTINYNSNGGSGTTTATTATYGSNVTLATDNFTAPSGKIFKAWGTDSSGTTTYEARTAVAPATLYPSVTTTQGGSITLYAIWETITNDGSKGNFQTANICSSIGVGHTATLKDTRDNQTYTVYRFRNTGTAAKSYPTSMAGYCIMTKDLSLGYVSGGSITKGGNLSLTTSTSNFDTSGSNSSYETITLSGTQTVTYRTDKSVWDTTNSYTNMQYTNGPSSAGNTYSTHSYYSYGAALVVCPKGWRLPTNTENGYIRTFMGGGNANGSAKIRSAPYNFVYGGFFVSSGWYDVGSSGLYWASTQGSSTNGYGLDFYSSSLGTYVDLKFRGRSVRCVSAP